MKIGNIDDAADIFVTLGNIDKFGSRYLTEGGEVTRSLGNGLWEIKKNKNRLYYCYNIGNKVYMLHACYKQKGKAEKNDLAIGIKRMREMIK